MISSINPEKKIIAEIRSHAEVFAKKVTVPLATVLFIQNQPGRSFESMSRNDMIRVVSEVGWQEEAMRMEEGSLFKMENVPIYLQRATAFSDTGRNVILLGDAAGTGSFYQGTGVNFCFKTTELAGKLFRGWPQREAYVQFDHDMEVAVEGLINTSLPLFFQDSPDAPA